MVEHDDLVGQRDRRQAVGDDERRAPGHRLVERELDLCSVEASTEEVASSRISTRGSASSARAIARRWRWPPESVRPRSPTCVS